ncbi:hypothetical protein MMC26_005229 [Xylographa opegraphella]|nr:hypothetical protein [Xylographa opegraphella]
MPVLSRRQPLLDLRSKSTGSITPPDDEGLKAPLWLLAGETFEAPQKERDFTASIPSRRLKPKQKSRSNLRLSTQTSLHERYESSEEEASPSPEGYASSADESSLSQPEETTKISSDPIDLGIEVPSDTEDESDALPTTLSEPATAITMAIFNAGRPKLISIAALAPMQKRKRTALSPVSIPTTRLNSSVSAAIPTSPASPSPPRKRSASVRVNTAAPTTWLPEVQNELEESMSFSEEEEADDLLHAGESDNVYTGQTKPNSLSTDQEEELYFPAEPLPTSPTPTTYAEYDPYSLDPPRLSGSHDYGTRKSSLTTHRPYSSKAEGTSIRSVRRKQSWMGFGKSLGLGRRERTSGTKPGAKGTEKTGKRVGPMIPAFEFEE